MTMRSLKIQSAAQCIQTHRDHVSPNGAACYPTLADADSASRQVLSASDLDSAEIVAAYRKAGNQRAKRN